jgi:hypothetical protein
MCEPRVKLLVDIPPPNLKNPLNSQYSEKARTKETKTINNTNHP